MWGRRLLFIAIGAVVIIGGGVAGIFWATGGVASAGDRFVKLVSSGRSASSTGGSH